MSFDDLEAGRLSSVRRAPQGPRSGKQLLSSPLSGQSEPQSSQNYGVAEGVFRISTAVGKYSALANTLGTPRDTPELRDKLHKTRLEITQLIKDTTEKLKRASQADKQSEISANKRIADAKLAKDFKAIMQDFQKVQSLAAQREMAYAPSVSQTAYASHTTEIKDGSDRTQAQRATLAEPKRQELLLLENEIGFNEAIIEERNQSIQEIQQQIGEVSEIFKDLAVMVHEQGAIIEDISTNIENADIATADGTDDLVKASKTQKSGSSLICLLLVIFGIVLLIIIIVLAT